ncbi:hypothetical protein C4S77_10500 [Apibacter adventoris]|uniref:Uncharacterized protein n=2 Tax=Apibacter adventoris TaxID=1679466 RepID=A0A2S8A8I0_9FLAO|nr:hypothetical protein C4S77_10500 [Apibacter adventoris]
MILFLTLFPLLFFSCDTVNSITSSVRSTANSISNTANQTTKTIEDTQSAINDVKKTSEKAQNTTKKKIISKVKTYFTYLKKINPFSVNGIRIYFIVVIQI